MFIPFFSDALFELHEATLSICTVICSRSKLDEPNTTQISPIHIGRSRPRASTSQIQQQDGRNGLGPSKNDGE